MSSSTARSASALAWTSLTIAILMAGGRSHRPEREERGEQREVVQRPGQGRASRELESERFFGRVRHAAHRKKEPAEEVGPEGRGGDRVDQGRHRDERREEQRDRALRETEREVDLQ